MAKFEFLNKATAGASKPGSKLRKLLVLPLIAVIGIFVVYQSLSTYLRPYEVGIKESRYGGGVEKEPYFGPALLFTAPGVTFHRFPLVTQTLNMTDSAEESGEFSLDSRNIRALEVDSSDGSKIRIDATILYRILDPYEVMSRVGPGRLFEDNAVIPKANQAMKESLGGLKAEDFYNEVLRVNATEKARQKLIDELKDLGLTVDYVLIRQYYYLPDYQHQIEERKVQDQLVFTNQAMGESAKMEALRRKLDAEGEAAVNVEKQRGDAEVTKIRAEGDLYSRKVRAEADLLVALADARGTELENAAYKASAGSDNLVGLEMAEVLEGVDVIFVQSGKDGVNFMDLNQTLRMFDVK